MSLYLCFRLFLGMGIIWFFELLSFAVDGDWSYFTDTLNMLQVGVWVG